jgi:hypothetical protein
MLGSVNVSGLEAAANVAARGEMANALGEGFADGLDVGGFWPSEPGLPWIATH